LLIHALVAKIKVRTDSSTEFGLDPILIDRIRIDRRLDRIQSWSFRSAHP